MKLFPRGVKGHLDYYLRKFYKQILDKYKFELIDKRIKDLAPLVAIYTYRNDTIKLNLINDKGKVNCNIASVYGKDDFYDLDVLKILIKTKSEDLNEETLKYYLTRSMTPSEEVKLLDNKMALIGELFDKNNFEKTQKELGKIGWKRAEFLFGKDFQNKTDS